MPSLAQLTDSYSTDPMGNPLPVEQPFTMPEAAPIPDNIPRVVINTAPNTEEVSPIGSKVDKILNKLFRDDDQRYQLWPEKVVREGITAAHDVMEKGTNLGLRREDVTDIPPPQMPTNDSTWLAKKLGIAPVAASPQDDIIEKAGAISALAGSGGLGGGAEGTALNATPSLRPALKYKDRLYKGKEGQQHMDVIPKELYPEFQQMAMNGEDISHYNFGFVNDKGQFLNREKALEYGINSGIIDPQAGKFGALTSTLMADSSKPGTAIEGLKFAKNPNSIQLENLLKRSDENSLRGMVDDSGVHLWDATKLTHTDGAKELGLNYNHENRFHITKSKDEPGYSILDIGDEWTKNPDKLLSNPHLVRFLKNDKLLVDAPGMGKITGPEYLNILKADSSKPGTAIEAVAKTASPFYSAVEHQVANIPQAKMTGEQWLGTLTNKPGVKGEELQWTGLQDFLLENKGKPVTKQQIEEHLASNKVELKEVGKGKGLEQAAVKDLETAIGQGVVVKGEKLYSDEVVRDLYNGDLKVSDLPTNLQPQAQKLIDNLGGEPTKYHFYQLPGGENYREMLLTLPSKAKQASPDEINKLAKTLYETYDRKGGEPSWEELAPIAQKEYRTTAERKSYLANNPGYLSSHWDEPNILAHVRMNDRNMQGEGFAWKNKTSGNTSQTFKTKEEAQAYFDKNFPNGHPKLELVSASSPVKSLHLEEIQSDWHQQGRDKGYAKPIDKDLEKSANEIAKRVGDTTPDRISKNKADQLLDYNKITEKEWNILTDYGNAWFNKNKALPDAPFKKSWHELALKRMIREAAEKGYDRLSWTPGEAQAARYDLSKSVKEIHYNPNTGYSKILDKNGKDISTGPIPKDKLADTIGKEAAQKLLESKPNNLGIHSLEGQDLKIGGEGMKGFYDQIIPKALEKIGKEHGVKVKTDRINKPEFRVSTEKLPDGREAYDVRVDGKLYSSFHTKAEAEAVAAKAEKEKKGTPIHYIDIPQSLKDQAMHKGFPLFAKGGFMLMPVDHEPEFKK